MFFKSFKYAVQGIRQTIQGERNLCIMLVVFVLVIGAGCAFAISALEWIAVLICCGGVLALELINSAIERMVDLVTQRPHPLAKAAKDMAAGAVLVWSVCCAIIGIIIFLPRLISLLHSLFQGALI